MRSPLLCLVFALIAAPAWAATFTVTNANNAGAGSLRDAVNQANATPATDTIVFDTAGVFATSQTITLGGSQIPITAPLTIDAPSASTQRVTINAASQSRVFSLQFTGPSTVTLRHLTIRNGVTTDDGGGIQVAGVASTTLALEDCDIRDCTARDGGGIDAGVSALTITDSLVRYNDATRNGAGLICRGILTITNSELYTNAAADDGGAIFADGGAGSISGTTILGSTAARGAGLHMKGGATIAISGGSINNNTARDEGGGLRVADSSSLTMLGVKIDSNDADRGAGFVVRASTLAATNCLVVRNDAAYGGGLYFYGGTAILKNCTLTFNDGNDGAGIFAERRGVELGNTVVTENPAYGNDNLTGAFATLGHNFIGYLGTATGFANGVDGDIVGETSMIDARLDMNNNFAPMSRSRCLEGGDTGLVTTPTYGFPPFTDVLGNLRIRGVVDIGAVEGTFNAIVTNANDSGAGSLRDALAGSPTDISFDPTFFSTLRTITLTSGQITLSTDLVIAGPDPGVIVSGNNASRVFEITGGNVTLRRVRMINGSSTDGGGIRVANAGTTVTLDGAGISNSTASGPGGGLYVQDASTVIATNCTFSNNTANGDGGGIHINGATFNLTNSTVSTNSSKGGGGGLYAGGTNTTTIINCTFADNTCDSDAGGAAGNGGGIRRFAGTVSVGNTIVARNDDASASVIHPDVSGIFTSLGNNLIGKLDGIDGSGGVPFQNGTNGDLAGTIATPLAPGLNALQQNPPTSPTRVHPLQTGSPARDAGNPALLTNAAWPSVPVGGDQRGQFRTVGSSVDIGAVEFPDTNLAKISVNDDVTSERTARVASFKIRRSFDDGTDLVVNLGVSPISTASSSDYTLSGAGYVSTGVNVLTVTIPAGRSYVVLDCVATQDAVAEGVETVSLFLVGGTYYGLDPSANNVATVSIYDDEYTVTSTAGSGPGSLREAINNANIGGGGVITMPTAAAVTLGGSSLAITSEIEIVGNNSTISAGGLSPVFYFDYRGGYPIILRNLRITGGNTTGDGGAMFVDSYTTVEARGCTVIGNVASSDGGGIAVNSAGSLSLTNCSVMDNIATLGSGGGIMAFGALTCTNTTVGNNRAAIYGGGIYAAGMSGNLINCTITQNLAASSAGFGFGAGGGVYAFSTASLGIANTVVAGNFDTPGNSGPGTVYPDVAGSGAVSSGYNFIGNNAGTGLPAGQPNGGNNYVGTAANPLDPQLSRVDGLRDTYYEFGVTSALRDHGLNAFTSTTNDQRGVGRIFGPRVDIGAVEMDFLLVNTTSDLPVAGTLRTAIANAAVTGHGTIIFDTAVFNVPRTISLLSPLNVTASIVVQGPEEQLTIGGGGFVRVFSIAPVSPVEVELRNVDVVNAAAAAGGAGALVSGTSTLILNGCEFRNCSGGNGSAVNLGAGSALYARDCTFSGHSTTGAGGAIYSAGTVAIERTTFANNQATTNGGAFASVFTGSLTNCTFSGNRANNHGGAVYQAAGASDTLTLTHGTLTLNRANDDNTGGGNGGGLRKESGILAVKNTIVSGNDALGNTQDDISGTFSSLGNNLIGTTSGGTGFTNGTNGDLVGANAYLLPLGYNGGPTATHPIGAGSAAVNAAAAVSGLTDQRGLPRTTPPDIGAYELQPESYVYWAAHTFPSLVNAGANADWDGDRISNAIEFAAGSDPMNANSLPMMTPSVQGGNFVVTFTASPLAPSTFARIMLSTDLITWTPAAAPAYSVVGASSDGINRLVQVTVPLGGSRRFARWELQP